MRSKWKFVYPVILLTKSIDAVRQNPVSIYEDAIDARISGYPKNSLEIFLEI